MNQYYENIKIISENRTYLKINFKKVYQYRAHEKHKKSSHVDTWILCGKTPLYGKKNTKLFVFSYYYLLIQNILIYITSNSHH